MNNLCRKDRQVIQRESLPEIRRPGQYHNMLPKNSLTTVYHLTSVAFKLCFLTSTHTGAFATLIRPRKSGLSRPDQCGERARRYRDGTAISSDIWSSRIQRTVAAPCDRRRERSVWHIRRRGRV